MTDRPEPDLTNFQLLFCIGIYLTPFYFVLFLKFLGIEEENQGEDAEDDGDDGQTHKHGGSPAYTNRPSYCQI